MAREKSYFVYVGGYTRGQIGRGRADGIGVFRLLPASGALEPIGLAPNIANPTFLAISADHKHVYAINEIANHAGQASGAVSAFAIDQKTGLLTLINQQATQGPGSAHISLDKTGAWALVANYRGGSVSVLPVQADGSLGAPTAFVQHSGHSGADPKRQEAPHAHSIIPDPSNKFVTVCDLGMDKVLVYRLDGAHGTLTPNSPAFIASRPGAGPRHQIFHPNGRWYYVINELDSTVSVLEWDVAQATGREVQAISTLPAGYTGENACAEIRMSPSSRFVYGSNRGHDSIAIFAVDGQTGRLAAAGHASTLGEWPRNFELTPGGDLLLAANEHTDTVVSFRVDQATGQLTPTGHVVASPTPTCVRMFAAP